MCSSTRQVYGISEVIYVPLEYGRASATINKLIKSVRKPVVSASMERDQDFTQGTDTGSLHVKWAPQNHPNVTPDAASILSSSPASSGYSTPTSGGIAIAPLAKALAERLSFWKNSGAPTQDEASLVASKTSGDYETLGELMDDIDNGETAAIEPSKAVEDIVTAAATEPSTSEERNTRLEDKILKETVRQFTKGGMYFTYSFGKDPKKKKFCMLMIYQICLIRCKESSSRSNGSRGKMLYLQISKL